MKGLKEYLNQKLKDNNADRYVKFDDEVIEVLQSFELDDSKLDYIFVTTIPIALTKGIDTITHDHIIGALKALGDYTTLWQYTIKVSEKIKEKT